MFGWYLLLCCGLLLVGLLVSLACFGTVCVARLFVVFVVCVVVFALFLLTLL